MALASLKLRVGRVLADPRFYWNSARLWPERVLVYAWARVRLRSHRVLDEAELRATRRSSTVFVFGSGWSLNELEPEEFAHFEAHDTLGFNWFVHQQFVRSDYHLVREIPYTDLDRAVWRAQVTEYFELARGNPRYRKTVFLLQSGLRALNSNRALALGVVPERNPVFLYRSVKGRARLGRSLADGLSHPHGTLEDCVNFAALLGWKEIVLVGVDLYDRRYFWLAADETRVSDRSRGSTYDQPHTRAGSGLIENMGRWRAELEDRSITLSVYNPRSLLSEVLPVYRPPDPAPPG